MNLLPGYYPRPFMTSQQKIDIVCKVRDQYHDLVQDLETAWDRSMNTEELTDEDFCLWVYERHEYLFFQLAIGCPNTNSLAV